MRDTMISVRGLGLAALCALGAASVGAQVDYAPGAKVVGKIRPGDPINLALTPREHRPIVQRNLERLLDVVLKSPPFNPPVGFEAQPVLQGFRHTNKELAGGPLGYRVTALIYWYLFNKSTQQLGPSVVSYVAMRVVGNDLSPIWGRNQRWRRVDGVVTYWEPQQTGTLGGFPYYDSGVVVLTNSSRPLFVPLSRADVLRIELNEQKATLSKLPPDPKNRSRVTAEGCVSEIDAELSRLSEAELAAPAYLSLAPRPGRRTPICSFVVDEGFPHARRIVKLNPEFYDRSLPPTALQVIVVDHSDYLKISRALSPLFDRIRQDLDYAGLAAMLEGQ